MCPHEVPSLGWLDGALYPDTEPPDALQGLAERVDFRAAVRCVGLGAVARAGHGGAGPPDRMARGGGCLPVGHFARLSSAAYLARVAAIALPGAATSLYS